MPEVEANEKRTTGPAYDRWPAELPYVAYVCQDGAILCVTCANGGNGSEAGAEDLQDGSVSDDPNWAKQWRVIGAQLLDVHSDRHCAHCNRVIPIWEGER